jgi:hypothetical protein
MVINLRKANALQAEIRKVIASIKLEPNVTVTEFTEDIMAEIFAVGKEYQSAILRKERLITALYNIRKSVAQANANSSINTILADIECLDQLMAIHTQVASQPVMKSLAEITARVEKLKTTNTESSRIYGDRYNSVETTVLSKEALAAAKVEAHKFKQKRQGLQDDLLQLNVTTIITINGEDEATLRLEGIV